MPVQVQALLTRMMPMRSSTPEQGDGKIKFLDLFCGIGGASTGAVDAGLDVVFAADFCPVALASHAHNHPGCEHREMTFPCEDDDLPWPEDAQFHLHGSPPCTRLTPMQMQTDPEKIEEAVSLVKWFVQLAVRKSPARWSMEQVGHPRIREILDKMRRSNRFIDYVVVDFAELQVPQHRRRLIAGPPWLIDNIRAFRSVGRYVPLGRAVASMPPGVKYIRNSLVNKTLPGGGTGGKLPKRKSMRRVTRPSFTVVTTIALRWYGRDKRVVRSMRIAELLIVQGYPAWYTFPATVHKSDRLRGVGNSIPPMVMALALGKRPRAAPLPRVGERGACGSGSDTEEEPDQEPEAAAQPTPLPLSPSLRLFPA
jgi:site-specific DNA-cytosine methylase